MYSSILIPLFINLTTYVDFISIAFIKMETDFRKVLFIL